MVFHEWIQGGHLRLWGSTIKPGELCGTLPDLGVTSQADGGRSDRSRNKGNSYQNAASKKVTHTCRNILTDLFLAGGNF